jgi:murein L,D-transpeptidase YafK
MARDPQLRPRESLAMDGSAQDSRAAEERGACTLTPRFSIASLVAVAFLGVCLSCRNPTLPVSAPKVDEIPTAPVSASKVDEILVEKGARRLTLFSGGSTIRTYSIALGRQPIGPKIRQGDDRTPEGSYVVDSRNYNSAYHLALHLSYPNAADRARAAKLGVSPGGDIMIHGLPNGLGWLGPAHRRHDWTRGCIAVTDMEIEEIARLVPDGTSVEVRP